MIKFLHTFYFDVRKPPDQCFKMLVDGEQITSIPVLHAGETTRGLRVILTNFKYEESINCIAYFKTDYENKVIRVTPHNRNKNSFDIYFPTMKECNYECEIIVSSGDEILSSGVFQGICDKEIKSSFYQDYTPRETVEDILNKYNEYSTLYKKYIDNLGKFANKIESDVARLSEEVKKIHHASDKTFIHEQIFANNIWTIEHNLNKYPSVSVVDSGGNVLYGDIKHLNENVLVISFLYSFSGKAICN